MIPWCREPTKDQWLGWTLDAFDFTMFLLILVPISKEFGVALTVVAFVLSVTLWLRLVGAVTSGWIADRIGRRWSMIIPAAIAILIAPIYLLPHDLTVIIAGFTLQGLFGQAIYGQNPSYLAERFPTEVRATAGAFVYHLGSFCAGFVPLILTGIASGYGVGFGISMLIGTVAGATSFVFAVLCGPETKGKVLDAKLVLA